MHARREASPLLQVLSCSVAQHDQRGRVTLQLQVQSLLQDTAVPGQEQLVALTEKLDP